MRENVSACITVGNEEPNIRRCLESVRWADEIVVVDSFSQDRTPEICREYTDRVYQHRWLGYVGQKNLIKDLATGEWVLFIDGDEEVSAALRDEILAVLEGDASRGVHGYEFPRRVWYLGRWIKHGDWYPDRKLRLFRKAYGRCGGREPHDRIIVEGPIRRLRNPVYHYTYSGIVNQLSTLNRFSTITAKTHYEEGRRFRLADLLFRPVWRFVRGYVLRLGFLDGLPGLIIASTSAYGVFAKYAKLWELETSPRQKPADGAG
jgi:glycosyltransferase involved in cell wall biosynthesis